MITRKKSETTVMQVSADCYWGRWCDVGIVQEWTREGKTIHSSIELKVDEAEELLEELRQAISLAKQLQEEYNKLKG